MVKPPPVVAQDLGLSDLGKAVRAGWRDFAAAPLFGLFFAAIYVAAGIALYVVVWQQGHYTWLIPAMAAFPIVAPFAAVGLYEVSRRREQGEPLKWGAILGALRGRGDDQIMLMGAFIFVVFAFWVIIAHGVSLIFLADFGSDAHSLDILMTGPGIAMLLVGSVAGGLLAWGLFSITVISLPLLVDRKVDAITAIIASVKVVRGNLAVMLAWAAIIAASLIAAMIPALLGLLVVLPVLGHATWHLYKRAIVRP